jgi:radical SAM protein with 4Fe4S-binding SPASM domain
VNAGAELVRDLEFARGVLLRRPFSLLLQVTNRCNMTCSFCDFWPNGVAPAQELSLADLRRVADELAQLGCALVSIEGGEPCVRPDLVEIVRAFSARHLSVLYTNGWYVTPALARELFGAGLLQVGVSIDYPDERHDRRRGLPGARARAWAAVEALRDAAPHAGRQVHVITVLMRDNERDLEALLRESSAHGVGHVVTLLSDKGYRRGKQSGELPDAGVGARLLELWRRYPHWRFFREYVERVDDFLGGGPMPRCGAGTQSFNVDHVGNVSVCIERIDRPVGNVRGDSLLELHARLQQQRAEVAACQECWTACRGFAQALRDGGSPRGWLDLALRMRSH